jgi:hypothetical protein
MVVNTDENPERYKDLMNSIRSAFSCSVREAGSSVIMNHDISQRLSAPTDVIERESAPEGAWFG